MKHYLNAFENYANFSGRASVSQYWTFYIICILSTCISALAPPIFVIFLLVQIIPALSIFVRRLHDTGHSGAYIFLMLIPIIGWIWILILLLKEGDVSSNKYGMPSSSSDSSTNSKYEEVMEHNSPSKSNTDNKSSSKPKEYTNVPKEAFNSNKENIVEQIDEVKGSNDISQLTEIEKIERQYEKGIFTEQEKNDLINKILKEKQNDEIEKIKENYNSVLDPYRDRFLEIYSIECVELEDLHNQGIIDKKTLKSKLKILEINIAKRIQKQIKFKSIKGFEVYQGLEVKNDNLVGIIAEIVNSKEVRIQSTVGKTTTLSKRLTINDIFPTGKVYTNISDWDLDENNFLLQNDLDYYKVDKLKVGDSYKEGEVFFVSNEEIKIFLIFDKLFSAKPQDFEQNTFIKCDYKTLKSKEDKFWKIPDVESVKNCVKYLNNQGKFVPIIPEVIWTSEKLDSSNTKCIQVANNHSEPTTIIVSDNRHNYGILVQTIKI